MRKRWQTFYHQRLGVRQRLLPFAGYRSPVAKSALAEIRHNPNGAGHDRLTTLFFSYAIRQAGQRLLLPISANVARYMSLWANKLSAGNELRMMGMTQANAMPLAIFLGFQRLGAADGRAGLCVVSAGARWRRLS